MSSAIERLKAEHPEIDRALRAVSKGDDLYIFEHQRVIAALVAAVGEVEKDAEFYEAMVAEYTAELSKHECLCCAEEDRPYEQHPDCPQHGMNSPEWLRAQLQQAQERVKEEQEAHAETRNALKDLIKALEPLLGLCLKSVVCEPQLSEDEQGGYASAWDCEMDNLRAEVQHILDTRAALKQTESPKAGEETAKRLTESRASGEQEAGDA